MTDIDAPFMEKTLNVAQWKRKSDLHHYGKADDLR
jgi:hypothetical protein